MKTNLLAILGATLISSATHAQITTIEDVLGRSVELDVPVKRVVLGFYAEDYMAIGSEQAFDHVVGISRDTWQGWRPASWELYTDYRPALKDIPDVGEVEAQTFSIEKVLSLNPDVVLLADWQYKGLGMDVETLEDAGIPIVVIDYNAQTLERHLQSTHIIGELTGQAERANQIANEYEQTVTHIHRKIADAGLPQPRVYVEFGNQGPNEYSFTYGKNMWGAMVSSAGGNNIAAPFVEWWGPINPEQVIASNPEVIFIAGTESGKKSDAMIIGQNIDRTIAKERLEGFTHRSGWSELEAVKNNRVYGIYQGASRTIMDGSMLQFIAKAQYPELFHDLTPEQNYLEFYRRYLPVTPTGTFTVSLQD
ncbi:ABC transporter substrate-binding protein [Marinomonas fungiae]|uniref:ABC-type Fe3+-hydroxamate transport system, periplasmic component n=1 Tax=Marinomonas fungiae TaxID=1137284 RepID=A0A0K6IPU1_9GAMM|nr:ABC transporter substrate-binding protein [Marinomonas fungiae]CUB05111.1 ABC-type Fe3+-hydroxamate transport system, periplasmic component [Marinomonas fungiae]